MPIDIHLTKLERGDKFFQSLQTLCWLGITFTVLSAVAQLWKGLAHDAEGTFWSIVMGAVFGLLQSLPYLVVALGLHHIRSLFGAVREAIRELQTTV